jgi:hypothetical protein
MGQTRQGLRRGRLQPPRRCTGATPNTKLQAPNLKPSTPKPKLQTPNSKPPTPNPSPSTVNPKPWGLTFRASRLGLFFRLQKSEGNCSPRKPITSRHCRRPTASPEMCHLPPLRAFWRQYRGTSIFRNPHSVGPSSRTMSRLLWWS